jgi:serine/threonine-protein kinase
MFIVMEYIDGQELKDRLNTESMTIDEVITTSIQIVEGLQAAHEKGITHRDIKSSNIMVTESGQIKIMDFGLAKITGSGVQITKDHSTPGTAAYMSPEQTRGEEVDQRTDIWSFGVVLYEMLTGKLPFGGDYEQAVMYSILNEEPEPITDISPEVEQVVMKALAKNPDDRYQTADDVASDLQAIGDEQSGRKKPVAKKPKLPWMIAAAMVVVMAFAFYIFRPIEKPARAPVQTIAVLPFADMSPKKDQEYFSDGLSEELLNVLARNPQLRVTSRTSAFSFKGTNTDIKTIAAKLNVEHILEGSVRKAGNEVRITAQLIDVKTDAHLWAETYDGTLENIFALQDSISASVAEALKITLLGKESATQQRETDPQAYTAYLLGKHFYRLRGKENFEKATGYYRQALSIDPDYAPAWVGLSRTHSAQADQGHVPVDEGYRKARREVRKALVLDPNLAAAHSLMGWIKRSFDWDWSGANASFRRALELEPGDASIISNAARLAATLGRFNEAIRLNRRSIELDPVRVVLYNNLGLDTWYAGLLDESQTAFRKCMELNPQYRDAHNRIGCVYLAKGQPDSALAEMEQETEPFWQMYGLALVYHALGRNKEADDALSKIIEENQNDSAYQIAEIYAYRGETDRAFEWLGRAYQQRDGGLSEMKGDPLLRNIEKDPRYAAFMKKMKLPL